MSHWKKLDHVAFVLMLFVLFSAFGTSIIYPTSPVTLILIIVGIILWFIAFDYDLMEDADKSN